jgi:hypothetical protein
MKHCDYCYATEQTGGPKFKRCSGCKVVRTPKVYYCCEEHQRLDWDSAGHMLICGKARFLIYLIFSFPMDTYFAEFEQLTQPEIFARAMEIALLFHLLMH